MATSFESAEADARFDAWYTAFVEDAPGARALCQAMGKAGAVIAGGACTGAVAGAAFKGSDIDIWVPHEGKNILIQALNEHRDAFWAVSHTLERVREATHLDIPTRLVPKGYQVAQGMAAACSEGQYGSVIYSRLVAWIETIYEVCVRNPGETVPEPVYPYMPHGYGRTKSAGDKIIQLMFLLPGKDVRGAVEGFDLTAVQCMAAPVLSADWENEAPHFHLSGPGMGAATSRTTTWGVPALVELAALPFTAVQDWSRTLCRAAKYTVRGYDVDFKPWVKGWAAWNSRKQEERIVGIPRDWRETIALAHALEECTLALADCTPPLDDRVKNVALALAVACRGEPSLVQPMLDLMDKECGGFRGVVSTPGIAPWWGESLLRCAAGVGVPEPTFDDTYDDDDHEENDEETREYTYPLESGYGRRMPKPRRIYSKDVSRDVATHDDRKRAVAALCAAGAVTDLAPLPVLGPESDWTYFDLPTAFAAAEARERRGQMMGCVDALTAAQ